ADDEFSVTLQGRYNDFSEKDNYKLQLAGSKKFLDDTLMLQVVISPVNDFPSPVGDLLAPTTEDDILVITAAELLANDVDIDLGDTDPDELRLDMPLVQRSLRGALVTFDPETQTVTYNPTGRIVDPDTGEVTIDTAARELQSLRGPVDENTPAPVLVDSFSYAVTDRAGRSVTPNRASNSVLVTVNVSGVNDAPVLNPDTPTLNTSGSTTIDVLSNDEDIDGVILPGSIEITSQPAFGEVSINPDGTIVYNPFTDFPGFDEFEYSVRDDQGALSEGGRVTISPNAAPVVRDDNTLAYVGESLILSILDNDADPDEVDDNPNTTDTIDPTSIVIESGPSAGTVTPLSDGTVRYTPATGFSGRDSFQYSVADSNGRRSGLATVNLQVVASRLQNPDLQYDVNDDGEVSALDALLVINHLNRYASATGFGSSGDVPTAANLTVETDDPIPPDTYQWDGVTFGAGYFDVSGNRIISEIDALQVINELNRRDTSGSVSEPLPQSVVAGATSSSSSLAPINAGTVGAGEPIAPLDSGTSIDDSRSADEVVFETFDADEKWVDTTANGSVDTDVLDQLAASQSDTEGKDENASDPNAIDAAMAKLI
ncbi:MAG: tandem-95 repeat protein, partial [Rhodopirellula sp. JB053]